MSGHYNASDLKTAGKLYIMEEYLPAYLNIIHEHRDHIVYVDTHAGTGKSKVLDGSVTLRGSALLALFKETKGGFDEFVLFERDQENFELLAETIESEYGVSFSFDRLSWGSDSFRYAIDSKSEIAIFQMDSNAGVRYLAFERDRDGHHWFTFVDPERLRDLLRETVDTLIERGEMDLLINFHTTGVKRSVAGDHSRERAKMYTGIDDLAPGQTLQDYADAYCDHLNQANPGWQAIHKPMEDPLNPNYQFDMVFTSANDTARKIVRQIWNKENFWSEVREYMEGQRDDDDPSQSGLDSFY